MRREEGGYISREEGGRGVSEKRRVSPASASLGTSGVRLAAHAPYAEV